MTHDAGGTAFGAPQLPSRLSSGASWRAHVRPHAGARCPSRPAAATVSTATASTAAAGAEAVGRGAEASGRPAQGGAAGKAEAQQVQAPQVPGLALDARAFLSTHWGVRPLFLPGLLKGYESPVSADDLAGLACEPDVEARIITGSGDGEGGCAGERPYTLTPGPFEEGVFASPLCADGTPWTLLVHEVNRHVPAVAEVLDRFRLLPNWRVDDVMVSYATEGGGVGPHVDNYDVFLLQVAGKRRWRTSSTPVSQEEEAAALAPGIDIRVLRGGFAPDQDHVLSPGDCMYVSPRCPHWGEALDDDCMTFSIGFRAPAVADLAVGWAEEAAGRAALGAVFLSDVRRDLVANVDDPGRISDAAVDAAYSAVLSALADGPGARDRFRDWFCEQVSSPKRFREADRQADEERLDEEEAEEIVSLVLSGGHGGADVVRQQEGTVFAYTVVDGRARVYVDGEVVIPSCIVALAALLCGRRATRSEEYANIVRQTGDRRADEDQVRTVLRTLLCSNLLYVDPDDGQGSEMS
jgi:50S ribosomal protein L16 3-hydroxylase